MRLTRKKRNELCIELWTWCKKTGKGKYDWPRWAEFGHIASHCWFCEYANRKRINKGGNTCDYCPLVKQLGVSHCSKTHYGNWRKAETPAEKKKYAGLFLEQIESLRSKRQ